MAYGNAGSPAVKARGIFAVKETLVQKPAVATALF
jgi:hypothetical protein